MTAGCCSTGPNPSEDLSEPSPLRCLWLDGSIIMPVRVIAGPVARWSCQLRMFRSSVSADPASWRTADTAWYCLPTTGMYLMDVSSQCQGTYGNLPVRTVTSFLPLPVSSVFQVRSIYQLYWKRTFFNISRLLNLLSLLILLHRSDHRPHRITCDLPVCMVQTSQYLLHLRFIIILHPKQIIC